MTAPSATAIAVSPPGSFAADLDPRVCEHAMRSRDPRFDGRFFIAVKTTGIYCRPICPVRPPRPENVSFYPSAAAAGEAGFRPCLRCRPECAPGSPAWCGTSATVARALRLIADGELDDEGVERLAARLGVGERHLRRLFARHVGASPLAVARTRRLHFAKRLLDETDLPMADVALSAGFGSVRRFNAEIRATWEHSPSALRRAARERWGGAPVASDGVALRLPLREPYDWSSLIGFLAARAIPGVERVEEERYLRTFRLGGSTGVVTVKPEPGKSRLIVSVQPGEPRILLAVVSRVRDLFDLHADPRVIAERLGRHPRLGRALARRPGIRVPGAWDPFEVAVRAILGQQVTVKGATTLCGRLVERFGEPISSSAVQPGLERLFPEPERLARATPRELEAIGLPGARAAAIGGLARAAAAGELGFGDAALPVGEFLERFLRLPGVGDWTAQYVAMRGLRDPDAFPAGDLGVRRALARNGHLPSARAVLAEAEAWRPWRSYATMLLWMEGAEQAEPAS